MVDITSIQPAVHILALAALIGVAASLIFGAIRSALGVAAIGLVAYFGLWWWFGEQPIIPSEFGAWLDNLPDQIGSWIEWARDTFQS